MDLVKLVLTNPKLHPKSAVMAKKSHLEPKRSKDTHLLCDKYLVSNMYYRLTREEREEAYNRARERIFGTSEKQGEPNAGMLSNI